MSSAKLLFFVGIFCTFFSAGLCADTFFYQLPPNIQIKPLAIKNANNGRVSLLVEVKSLLGELTNLKIRFVSSKDLKVITNTRALSSLKQGEAKRIKILAVPTGFVSDYKEPWLKILVDYLPDYPAQNLLANDTAKYPQNAARHALIQEIAESCALNKIRTDGYRHTVKAADNNADNQAGNQAGNSADSAGN